MQEEHKIQSSGGPLHLTLDRVRPQPSGAACCGHSLGPPARCAGAPVAAREGTSVGYYAPLAAGAQDAGRAAARVVPAGHGRQLQARDGREPAHKQGERARPAGSSHCYFCCALASLRGVIRLAPPRARRTAAQAHASIRVYGVHAVVANMLHTRKDRVYLVTGQGGNAAVRQLDRPPEEQAIERLLVAAVAGLHAAHACAD